MAFSSEVKLGNIQENWLFELSYNSGTLYLALADYNDGTNFYHGVVLNKPSIRESISLESSTASTSNISLDIPDFDYQGNPISELLFGGSTYFINHTATVKSVINEGSAETIGYFRFVNMSRDANVIKISLVSHRIWDFVDLPTTKTSRGKYSPIVYGNYTKNSNTEYIASESPNFGSAVLTDNFTNDDYFPVLYHRSSGGREEFSTGIHSISSNAEGAYYDSAFDVFIPFTNPTSANALRGASHYITKCNKHFTRGFGYRPNDFTDHHAKWDNEEFAYDNNLATYAEYEEVFTSSASTPNVTEQNTENDLDYSFTIPTGKLKNGTLVIEFQTRHLLSANYVDGTDTYTVKTYVDVTGTGDNFVEQISEDHTDADGSTNNFTKTFTFSEDNDDKHPDVIKIGIFRQIIDAVNAGVTPFTATTEIRIKDIKMFSEVFNEEKDGLTGYCAGDGLTNSWDSSPITKINEAHRDMLIRFAGMVTTTPTNWSTLDSTKDWGIRYWQNELEPLSDILERLQYEGGFIFKFKRGNISEPEYIYIKDSYSSGDVQYTITKNDISSPNIKVTNFSDLITKMNVNYQLHATEDKYIKNKTASSYTVRNNFNIQSKENIVDVDLDAYVSPDVTEYNNSTLVENANPNDDFFAYYYNISGVPRLIISANIVNPSFYDIDVGDIVQFSDMYPEKAFGKAFTNLVFMITSLSRTQGVLKIQAREIGEI